MLFLLVLTIVALALFTGLKLAFLIFLGLVAIAIIAIALMVGSFIHLGSEGDDNDGPMDKLLFGGKDE
jgi:hypothetical protein